MRRRRLLTTFSTLILPATAGCGSRGGDSGNTPTPTASPTPSPTPTATPSPSPTTSGQQAVEDYDTAIAALVENKKVLDKWASDGFEGDSAALETLQQRVSTAREYLKSAVEHTKTGQLTARINQARRVADFQGLSISFYNGFLLFRQSVADARAFADSNQHQRAVKNWIKARQVVVDVQTAVADMETVLKQIDTEVLDEPKLAYTDGVLNYIDLGDRRVLDAAEKYVIANKNAHLAVLKLHEGNSQYENKEYAKAHETWITGLSYLKKALKSFKTVLDNKYASQGFRADSMNKITIVKTLLKAFKKFIEGAKNAKAGNVETGDQLVDEGWKIIRG